MRVLHVLDHSIPLHSGYTFRTRAILEEQRKLGWETFHLTSAKHNVVAVPEEEIDGLHFFRTPTPQTWQTHIPLWHQVEIIRSLSKRLEQIIGQVQPDIVHAHSPALNGIAALDASRRLGLPLVYEVRAFWEDAAVDHGTSRQWGLRYRLTRALETYVLRRTDAITTICEGLRNEIIARGISADKITVIHNAVDLEQFSQHSQPDLELKQRLNLHSARILGFIGSFYAYEGLTLLLQSLPAVLARAPDVRFLLVGGGLQEQALKDLAGELGIADKVIFTGRVAHSEVQRYYDLVDILVYPRLSMRLTDLVTPLKPLEAMAQCRLLIASDVGGHRELIRDGQTGILFRAGDSADLTVKILDLLAHPQRASELRAQARRFVETERSWAVSVARYRLVYESLL